MCYNYVDHKKLRSKSVEKPMNIHDFNIYICGHIYLCRIWGEKVVWNIKNVETEKVNVAERPMQKQMKRGDWSTWISFSDKAVGPWETWVVELFLSLFQIVAVGSIYEQQRVCMVKKMIQFKASSYTSAIIYLHFQNPWVFFKDICEKST